jgi:hypothetical protein
MIQKNNNKVVARGSNKRNRRANLRARGSREGIPQTIVRYSPSVFGFPDRMLTKLRYHDTITITSTSGIINVNVFTWNSTYDPDVTNSGHQPLYRDTYASIYDHYAVVSARAKAQFINSSTTLSCMVGGVTDDDSSSTTEFNTIAEQAHAKHVLLTPLSGSKSSATMNFTWDCMQVLGIDPYTSQTYKTAVGSNPSETSSLILFNATTTGSTNSVIVDIEFEYDVLWTELTTPTGN